MRKVKPCFSLSVLLTDKKTCFTLLESNSSPLLAIQESAKFPDPLLLRRGDLSSDRWSLAFFTANTGSNVSNCILSNTCFRCHARSLEPVGQEKPPQDGFHLVDVHCIFLSLYRLTSVFA
jgi:hypothetical protein